MYIYIYIYTYICIYIYIIYILIYTIYNHPRADFAPIEAPGGGSRAFRLCSTGAARGASDGRAGSAGLVEWRWLGGLRNSMGFFIWL